MQASYEKQIAKSRCSKAFNENKRLEKRKLGAIYTAGPSCVNVYQVSDRDGVDV